MYIHIYIYSLALKGRESGLRRASVSRARPAGKCDLSRMMHVYMCKSNNIYDKLIYTDIEINNNNKRRSNNAGGASRREVRSKSYTPGLRNKISAYNVFARGWVAQESIVLHYQR